MADNITLNSGSGGDSLAADDISSVKYQRVKLIQGTDGVNDGDVSSSSPLNVQLGTALAATAQAVTAKLATDKIHDGLTELTPKFASFDGSSSGDNTAVAAVASKKIRVLAATITSSAAHTVAFEDGASGTRLTGRLDLAANGTVTFPFNPVGWFETSAGTLLNIELGGANQTAGCIVYVEV